MAVINNKARAYRHIREKLLRGDLRSRRSLSDQTLASELGMSRTPVREAVLQLEIEGLLQRVPRSGTRARQMSPAEYEELLDLRELMEGYAVSRAAQSTTAADLAAIDRACRDVHAVTRALREPGAREPARATALRTRLIEADVAFHTRLVIAARSRWVRKFLDDCHVLSRVFQFGRDLPVRFTVLGEAARVYRDHRRIYRAVSRRDPDAARDAMLRHLRIARPSTNAPLSSGVER